MKKSPRAVLLLTLGASVAVLICNCGGPPSPGVVLAPPGPADLGPATGLSTPPSDAVVFDLKYLARTGAANDISYSSYWGYGGSMDKAKGNAFIQDVQKQVASRLYYVQNSSFAGREWAAIEYRGRQALALYFDLNADGKFSENERIPPTVKIDPGFDFITPDFSQPLKEGGQVFCRTLLRVNFYGGSEPNCMWSPAALLEGNTTFGGRPARVLLFANRPAGEYDAFGSSSFSILYDQRTPTPEYYVPRNTLSSLINEQGQFYRLTIEGRRSNGLPARLFLVKDSSPLGDLAIKLAGTNSIQATLSSLYLTGVDDKTAFLRMNASAGKLSLPVGVYALASGSVAYGSSDFRDWEVSFTKGPCATVKTSEVCEVVLGQPQLAVRAVEEMNRYNADAGGSTFKKGTRIYLEPRITGKDQEVFSRFRQSKAGSRERIDRTPRITITGPGGKVMLSKNMEYG